MRFVTKTVDLYVLQSACWLQTLGQPNSRGSEASLDWEAVPVRPPHGLGQGAVLGASAVSKMGKVMPASGVCEDSGRQLFRAHGRHSVSGDSVLAQFWEEL